MKAFTPMLAVLSLLALRLPAQSPAMSCKDQGRGFCEIRENTIPATGALTVDGKQNGGISVRGADRSDILVRAMVQAQESSEAENKATAAQVIVHSSGGAISADGPARKGWSVTYEILVPASTNLRLSTNNGGVAVSDMASAIEIHAVNGGISLKNPGGNVRGETVNGGISATLAGTKWTGQGMDLSTKNGGISLGVPERFSALLDVATTNGGMSVRLPQTHVNGGERRLSLTLGSGGPLIRIHTENGGVSIVGNPTA